MPHERTRSFQYSLRIPLAIFTLTAAFLASVRGTDLSSACMYAVFMIWFASPVLTTFTLLYLQNRGRQPSKDRRD